MPDQIRETAGAILEATGAGSGSVYRVLVISEGRGSSGVYPRETLQEAARARVIPAGTFSFIDHPTATDAMDRPERSVRDLAAVTTTDATWSDEHNGLVAEMRVFGPYQQLLGELAEHIGLSILGDGEIETREGQRTVTRLAHVNSVDWVTRAGRGGKVLNLLEAARQQPLAEARNVGQWMESRLHQDFTNRADDMAANGRLTREERIHLSNAVGQGLSAFAAHLEANAPHLYERDIYDEPAAPAVAEGAPAPTNPTEENLMPQIEEARLGQLEEAERRVPTLEAERDAANARATAAEAERDRLRLANAARPLVAARLAEAEQPLPPAAQARVVEAVLAAGVPATEQGAVDGEALNAAVEAAATREAAYLAAIAPAAPAPAFGAFGSHNAPQGDNEAVTEAALAEYDAASARTFGRTITGA